MGLWGCKCCEAYKSEIEFLRSLVRPKPELTYDRLPTVTLEADAVIGGASEQIPASPMVDRSKQEEIESERARILSGTY
jgi:hypothetical protein